MRDTPAPSAARCVITTLPACSPPNPFTIGRRQAPGRRHLEVQRLPEGDCWWRMDCVHDLGSDRAEVRFHLPSPIVPCELTSHQYHPSLARSDGGIEHCFVIVPLPHRSPASVCRMYYESIPPMNMTVSCLRDRHGPSPPTYS